MRGVVFMCWCILPAALPVCHTPSTRQQRITPALLPWWTDCPTLSYDGCLHCDANIYWAQEFLMVSAQTFASSSSSSFHFRNYAVVTYPKLLKGETCLFFWGPLHLSPVCSLFLFVLMAPELLKELFLSLEHYLAVYLLKGGGLVLCWAGSYLCSPFMNKCVTQGRYNKGSCSFRSKP